MIRGSNGLSASSQPDLLIPTFDATSGHCPQTQAPDPQQSRRLAGGFANGGAGQSNDTWLAMAQRFSQDEINTSLWKACYTFRGTIDPSEYRNFILVMLFLKCISDVWRGPFRATARPLRG